MKQNNVNRRDFLRTASLGSLTTLGAGSIPSETLAAIEDAEPMKITKVEGIRFRPDLRVGGDRITWTWVRLHTNNGIVGIGETQSYGSGPTGILKDRANLLIGKDPRDIEKIWLDFFNNIHVPGWGGTEIRLLSAINMAQWDILGKALGAPVYRLLGGKSNQKLRIYNTSTSYRPVNNMTPENNIEGLVRYLLDIGIKAIKIYPYNETARKTNGNYISPADLENCLDWIKRIRDTVGYEMDIGLDFGGRWNLPCSLRIAESLEPYRLMWLEEIMNQDNMQSYAVLARETSIPICISERLATRFQFREMLESRACDIVMFDLAWVGGISEAKKIADMADTYYIPIAPHDFEGPISWIAAIHTATAATNFFILESCYPRYMTTYPYFLNNTPIPEDGFVTAPEGPGLGIELRTEPFENGDIIVETVAEI